MSTEPLHTEITTRETYTNYAGLRKKWHVRPLQEWGFVKRTLYTAAILLK
jgi:hypothetical protein